MSKQHVSDIIVSAYKAEKKHQLSAAIKHWNTLLQEDIDKDLRSTTHLNLAKLHHTQGNNDISLEEIEKAIIANPNSGEAYFVLGFLQFEKQSFTSAITSFEQALKYNDKDTGLYNNLANCYDRCGRFTDAIMAYSSAIAIDNTYIPSIYNRGNVYCKLKNYKCALQDLSNTIKLDKDFYQAYYNRGQIYTLIGKHNLATKDLKVAKELAKKAMTTNEKMVK